MEIAAREELKFRQSTVIGKDKSFDLIEYSEIYEALDLNLAKSKLSTNLEKRAYNRFQMGRKDETSIEGILFSQREVAFNSELSVLLSNTGCRKQSGRLTNDVIRDRLLSESNTDAVSIANTHNVHLVGAIKNLTESKDKVVWQDYLIGLTEWKRKRDSFKVGQVSLWTINRVRNSAAREFYLRNKKFLPPGGSAILRGPKPAKERICQGWINRGLVPLSEALSVEWPPHLGCPHFWDYVNPPKVRFFRRSRVCDLLWAGE